jgi:hypothetical protein
MLTVYPFLLKFLYIPLKNNYQSKAPLGNIFCLLKDTAAISNIVHCKPNFTQLCGKTTITPAVVAQNKTAMAKEMTCRWST